MLTKLLLLVILVQSASIFFLVRFILKHFGLKIEFVEDLEDASQEDDKKTSEAEIERLN